MRILLLTVAIVCAAQAALAGALPPGKPAGVRQAVSESDEVLLFGLCGALAAGGAALLLAGKSGGSSLAATNTAAP